MRTDGPKTAIFSSTFYRTSRQNINGYIGVPAPAVPADARASPENSGWNPTEGMDPDTVPPAQPPGAPSVMKMPFSQSSGMEGA